MVHRVALRLRIAPLIFEDGVLVGEQIDDPLEQISKVYQSFEKGSDGLLDVAEASRPHLLFLDQTWTSSAHPHPMRILHEVGRSIHRCLLTLILSPDRSLKVDGG